MEVETTATSAKRLGPPGQDGGVTCPDERGQNQDPDQQRDPSVSHVHGNLLSTQTTAFAARRTHLVATHRSSRKK